MTDNASGRVELSTEGGPVAVRGREATRRVLMDMLLNRTDMIFTLKKLGVECTVDRLNEIMPERWMNLRDILQRLV